MRILRRVLTLALFVALLVATWRFATLNGESVQVNYLFGELPGVALWMVVAGAFAAGGVLVGLVCLFEMARLGLLARRFRKRAVALEAEIHQLRNLPLAPEGAGPEGAASLAGPAVPVAGSAERRR